MKRDFYIRVNAPGVDPVLVDEIMSMFVEKVTRAVSEYAGEPCGITLVRMPEQAAAASEK